MPAEPRTVAAPPAHRDADAWWRAGVCYEVYPRSFADTTGDGVGDLRGVIDHLDHLAWLGVQGLWLNPVTVSPNADWGYDVSDYCDVDPSLGTLADLDELVAGARRRGIHVLLDLVPNHTSSEHPWFRAARSSRDDPKRDWYVWADPAVGGGPPNNWLSTFGGPAWTFDDATGQWYLHNFLPEQPDLNWWNPEVRDAFDAILRFWFDRGIAGFRIDVVHMVVKDAELRDNPPAGDDDPISWQLLGQRPEFTSRQPELHDVLRRWRTLADSYDPPRVLVGESHVPYVEMLSEFYGSGDDELHLAFNFVMLDAALEAGAMREVVERTEALLPPGAWPVWTFGNHDVSRFPTRLAGGDPARARAALVVLLALRGTPFLYYGDELAMPDTPIERDRLLDPVGQRFWPVYHGRDPARTPMPWRDEPGAGFTGPRVEPWLPIGDVGACNVQAQRHDPDSPISLARDLVSLRDAIPDLRTGPYRTWPDAPGDVWAWWRGERVLVACNLGDTARSLEPVRGLLRISTDRARDGAPVDGRLELDPWEAVVVWTDAPAVGG